MANAGDKDIYARLKPKSIKPRIETKSWSSGANSFVSLKPKSIKPRIETNNNQSDFSSGYQSKT